MQKKKALLALHDPIGASRLKNVLEKLNYDMAPCATVSKILRALSSETIPLVFCQEHLPDGSYKDVLRNCGPASRTALVVCAEFYDKKSYVEAMSLGAFDYITFPYSQKDVEWIIGNAARKAAARHAALDHQQPAAA